MPRVWLRFSSSEKLRGRVLYICLKTADYANAVLLHGMSKDPVVSSP